MPTDTSERGFKRLICAALAGSTCDPGGAEDPVPAKCAAIDADDWWNIFCLDSAATACPYLLGILRREFSQIRPTRPYLRFAQTILK